MMGSNISPGMLTERGSTDSIDTDFVRSLIPETLAAVGDTAIGSGHGGLRRLQEDMTMSSSLLLLEQQKIWASIWKVSLACFCLVSLHLKDSRIMLSLFAGFCSEPNIVKPPSIMMRGVSYKDFMGT